MILFSLEIPLDRVMVVRVGEFGPVVHVPSGMVIGQFATLPLTYLSHWGWGRRFLIGPTSLRSLDTGITISADTRGVDSDIFTFNVETDYAGGHVMFGGSKIATIRPGASL